MKILLIKCHKKTLFSYFEPVVTEPLELEYLQGVLDTIKIDSLIHDSLFMKSSYKNHINTYKPNIVYLTGYVTAVSVVLNAAQWIKSNYPKTTIVIGGIYAQINFEDFLCEYVDYVITTPSLDSFKKLILCIKDNCEISNIKGIMYKQENAWHKTNPIKITYWENFKPNRNFLKKNKNRTKYLNYKNIALLKSAHSCPFDCNFCYCKLLNSGHYISGDISNIIEELKNIDNEYIWIVDDTFLVDKHKVNEFCDKLIEFNINKKFIAYSRADFISSNPDIINKLSSLGFIDLIVGMEAINPTELNNYNKKVQVSENVRTIEILKESNINLTALFIVNPDYKIEDFKNLRKFIRIHKLKTYTLSIFTPMKGTALYEDYKEILDKVPFEKFDFLNLLIEPKHMSKYRFYMEFYKSYILQLFYSKTYINFFFNRLRGR